LLVDAGVIRGKSHIKEVVRIMIRKLVLLFAIIAVAGCAQKSLKGKDRFQNALLKQISPAISMCEASDSKKIEVGDVVEKYREFSFNGWVDGVKNKSNGILWQVKEIGDSGLVVQAVKVTGKNPELKYTKGQISWFKSNKLYRSAHPNAPIYQQALDSFYVCKDAPAADHSDVANLLVGTWAMRPLKEVKVGAANVTEFKEDGTYKLHNFRCTARNEYSRDPSLDSEGTWAIDGLDIVTTVTDPNEIKQIKTLLKGAFSPELLKSKERISSLSSDSLMTKQAISASKNLVMSYKKVQSIEPNCTFFGVF